MADQVLIAPPVPSDPVEIDLGDGVKRTLRYDVGSLRRIKAALGKGMLTGIPLDEELAALIWHGLFGPNGEQPDITQAQIEALPSTYVGYLIQRFWMAYSGSMPEKKAPATIKETQS